jgi:hypothetical protein
MLCKSATSRGVRVRQVSGMPGTFSHLSFAPQFFSLSSLPVHMLISSARYTITSSSANHVTGSDASLFLLMSVRQHAASHPRISKPIEAILQHTYTTKTALKLCRVADRQLATTAVHTRRDSWYDMGSLHFAPCVIAKEL